MEHQNLLYYANLTELETEQGTGGTVTTVRPGVAYEHANRSVRFNKKKTTYSVTINYKRINGTVIESSTTIETALVMPGKVTKLKVDAIEIEGYEPVSESVKLLVSADTSYDFLYKAYTAYTVTVNHMFSGETIACATTVTSDQVAEGDFTTVSIMPETISGYRYTGETPIVLSISSDTTYIIEYIEGAAYEFGDVVYYDGTGLQTINYNDWDSSLGEPLTIIAIPSNVAPDGNARIIRPLYNNGDQYGYAVAQFPIDSQTQSASQIYQERPTWNNDSGSPSYDSVTGIDYYTDLPIDSLSNYPCAGNGNYGYGEYGGDPGGDGDYLLPPMIKPNGELNEHCMTALTNGNAMTDWNGLGNTLAISGVCGAAATCLELNLEPIFPQGTWYLPALAELCYIMTNIGQINNIISSIFGDESNLTIGGWSSTRFSSTHCFCMADQGDIYPAEMVIQNGD